MDHYTLTSILHKRATGRGRADAGAVTFRDRTLTYAELDERSDRLAAGLAAAGFRHGERAGVLMHNCLEWVEILFALGKLGGVIVPLNYMLRTGEMGYILGDCEASWLFAEDPFADSLAELGAGRRTVVIGEEYERLIAAGDHPPATEVRSGDLLLLQYTSGTTGAPKGAMQTHETVLWNSYHQIPDFQLTSDEVYYVVPALCWAAGFHDLALATLWAGGRIVLNPSTGFSPAAFCETVARERVTSALLVPAVLKRILASGELTAHDLSSLRLLLSGGEPVPINAMEELHRQLPAVPLVQVYGMSEFPTLMLLLQAEEAMDRLGSTGKACSVAEIRVVDESGQDVAPGEIGEIWCRSPACLIGYYGNPSASADTLAGGWLHTGDLARADEEGYLYIAGRSKDMIISGGLNVYPAEIERVLVEQDGVTEAAVIGVEDEEWGEVGLAVVVTEAGGEVGEAALRAACKERLASFKVPKHFVVRAEPLPRTTSGKVQKYLLREAAAAGGQG